jgi:hypothetical protein
VNVALSCALSMKDVPSGWGGGPQACPTGVHVATSPTKNRLLSDSNCIKFSTNAFRV